MDPLFLPLLFIAVLVLPLILNSRRQKRAMADAQRLQNSLTDGDRVVTTSGLHGTVVNSADRRQSILRSLRECVRHGCALRSEKRSLK